MIYMKFVSQNYDETLKIAKEFAVRLKPGDIIALHGDIGVGKTVFVRGVMSCFGDETQVTSPTFSVMNIYDGTVPLYHFDLYRMEDEEEIYACGLDEYIEGNGISLIEWPDILSLKKNYDVTIQKNLDINEDYREIIISGDGYEDSCS